MSFEPAALRRARQRNKMSLADTARVIGRHRSVIARYETGEIQPPADMLATLMRVLDIDARDLFPHGGEGLR